jgi:hypothetical protein
MSNVKSLSDHKQKKKAKIYLEHISIILKIINLSIKSLERFEMYSSVQEILITLRSQKLILNSHSAKINKFLREKERNEKKSN